MTDDISVLVGPFLDPHMQLKLIDFLKEVCESRRNGIGVDASALV